MTHAAVEAICPKSPDPPLAFAGGSGCRAVVAGGWAAVLAARDGPCCGGVTLGRAGAGVGRLGAL